MPINLVSSGSKIIHKIANVWITGRLISNQIFMGLIITFIIALVLWSNKYDISSKTYIWSTFIFVGIIILRDTVIDKRRKYKLQEENAAAVTLGGSLFKPVYGQGVVPRPQNVVTESYFKNIVQPVSNPSKYSQVPIQHSAANLQYI